MSPFQDLTKGREYSRNMNGLQSEKNPLRIAERFYRPQHPPVSQKIRTNYPGLHNRSSPILEPAEPATIIAYVGEMEKLKPIQRQFCHLDLYYPDKFKDMKRKQGQGTTGGRKRASSNFLRPLGQQSIQQERDAFLKTVRAKSNAKEEANLSFYNTRRKSRFIMEKFCDDTYMNERSSPTFQNMLHRTIVMDDVLGKARSNDRKFIIGF